MSVLVVGAPVPDNNLSLKASLIGACVLKYVPAGWVRCHALMLLGFRGGRTKAHAISAGRLVVKVIVVEWQVLGRQLSIVLEVQT